MFVGVDVLDPKFNLGGGVLVAAVLLLDVVVTCVGDVKGDKSLSRALGCDGEFVVVWVGVAWEGLDSVGIAFFGGR